MGSTRKLDPFEIRVLGALMEKEQTTPDQYPLTLNVLLAACNQKTNREPVMELGERDLLQTLDALRREVLVWRSEGVRTERWQHTLDRRWELTPRDKAVMTLLLLRGPQTAAELRLRSDRLFTFATVEETETTLKGLSERFDRLAQELPRKPGQRESRWAHLVGQEVEGPEPGPATAAPATPPGVEVEERLLRLEAEVGELRSSLAELRSALGL